MEAECSSAPLGQLGDTAKDAATPPVASIFCEDSNSFGQTNGVIREEGIPYDPNDFSAEVALSVASDMQGQVVTEFTEAGCEPLSNQLDFQPVSSLCEATKPKLLESGEIDSGITESDEMIASNLKPGKTEYLETLNHVMNENSCNESSVDQVVIDSLKVEVSSLAEPASSEGASVVLESAGGGDGYDMELHVILEPSAGNMELAQLAEMTGDTHTQDLLAELQTHHPEYSDELHAPGAIAPAHNNNYHQQEEVLNRKELLDILEGNEPEDVNEVHSDAEKPNVPEEKVVPDIVGDQFKALQQEMSQTAVAITDGTGQHEVPEPSEEYLVTSCTEEVFHSPSKDAMVALRQLSTLPRKRKNLPRSTTSETSAKQKNKTKEHKSDKRTKRRSAKNNLQESPLIVKSEEANDTGSEDHAPANNSSTGQLIRETRIRKKSQEPVNKSKDLIKVLVEDWDDDEPSLVQPESITVETVATKESQETDRAQAAPVPDNSNVPIEKIKDIENKSTEETLSKPTLAQRRASRVIKKKVIFDPDNPDTFTSTKSPSVIKAKKSSKELSSQKVKSDVSPQRAKEMSPTLVCKSEDPPTPKERGTPMKNKNDISIQKPKEKSSHKTKNVTLWKKPPPKNNKQPKRLSEVDRLLMDEGAVNMMYQLNSTDAEVPKGKKNIKSKAAFIKKINQNSTPESNEIKFRERRKETNKSEDGQAREGRLRSSVSNSVASPSVCEEYETHSADDSIIIRRHSSSSYSSSCLSPRRLSDIDMAAAAAASAMHGPPIPTSPSIPQENSNGDKFNDVFMSESAELKKTDKLDKNDCLSLKEKLSSKLSRVLNMKRKREGKTDKLESKQKKSKEKNSDIKNMAEFKKISINFEEHVAEILILKEESETNNIYTIETLKELKRALEYIDRREEVSVTLLVSASGNLCGGLDLSTVLLQKADKKVKAANEIANSVRALFVCLEQHSKLVCAGVEGACAGVGLAVLALCDVVVASDRATFSLLAPGGAVVPGTAVLTSHRKSLCRSLITEMMVFGRQLSATEALARGLVSRTLWPDRFSSELRAMVRDMAAQPPSALQLKKRLLGLRNSVEARSAFVLSLDAERDLLAAYWSSEEGQATIRVAH